MDMDNPSTTRGEPVRQFSIFLPNRVGALLSVVRLINDSHAHVLGVSVQDSVDGTVVRLIVTDPDTVQALFIEKGIPHGTCELVVVELESASHFSQCLSVLLSAETNIHFCYPLLTRPHGHPALALFLEDTEFGTSILNANGFKVLYQGDLSR